MNGRSRRASPRSGDEEVRGSRLSSVAVASRAADADPVRSCAMRARVQAAKSRIGWMRTTAVDPEAEGLTASFPANRTWSSGKPRTTVQAAAYFYPWRELCEHTAPLCSLQGWLAPARRGLCAPRPSYVMPAELEHRAEFCQLKCRPYLMPEDVLDQQSLRSEETARSDHT